VRLRRGAQDICIARLRIQGVVHFLARCSPRDQCDDISPLGGGAPYRAITDLAYNSSSSTTTKCTWDVSQLRL